MNFSSILAGLQQQFAATWSNIVGYVSQGAQDVGNAVSGTYTDAKDLAISGISSISSSLDALSRWTQNQLASVLDQLGQVVSNLAHLDQIMVERARQYLLARLAAAPGAVINEVLTTIAKAGGQLVLPDPTPGAPWVVVSSLEAELNAAILDPAHPVRAAVDAIGADILATIAGTPPTMDPWPTDPSTIPGDIPTGSFAPGTPDARDLLTARDHQYVADTTS